jgi:hypothetical protein
MNKIIYLIFLLIFISSAKANTIYELIKIPNLEVYDLKTPNKLRYVYAKQPFTIGLDNNINCYNSADKELEEKYKIIRQELDRYDQKFLRQINLKYIVLCEDLSISGINTAGIPDHIMKTLIVDIKFDEKFFRRALHHEIFHIINDSYKDIFNESEWSKFNNKEFTYAGCSTCTDKRNLDMYLNTNGFITEYSKTTASEDMAEVYSHLMISKFPEKIDQVLQEKIQFIKSKIKLIDQNFKI